MVRLWCRRDVWRNVRARSFRAGCPAPLFVGDGGPNLDSPPQRASVFGQARNLTIDFVHLRLQQDSNSGVPGQLAIPECFVLLIA